MQTDMLCDVGIAARMYMTGSMKPKYGNYRYVQDYTELIAWVKDEYAKTGQRVKVAADLETVGLDPFLLPTMQHPGAYIVTTQFSAIPGTCDLVRFTSRHDEKERLGSGLLREQIEWLLNTDMITLRGANLKFDLTWLYVRAAINCTNFKFDTTLVGCLLDENRSNSLKVHTKIYLPELGGYDDEFDSKVDKSRMDLVHPDVLLPYAGGDGHATLGVSELLSKELQADPKLTSFYVNLLHPAARAFEQIERGGVCVDLKKFKELANEIDASLTNNINAAKKILGGRIVAKHQDLSKLGGLNLTKPSLLADFMFSPMGLNLKPKVTTAKTGAPSTSMDHMQMFSDVPEAAAFINLLEEYSADSKARGTYIGEVGTKGFLEHIRSDGRFHPTYWLFVGDKADDEGGTVCLPASELMLTNRGYLYAPQVQVGDKVISHTGRERKVTSVVLNGVKPLVKVTMSNGLSLTTTQNHEYRIGDGWVEAQNLVVGMQAWAHSGVEEWAGISGWPDFEVSSWGRVFNKKTKNMLTQYPKGKWGHLKVCLYRNGSQVRGEDRKDFAVHRLVANAFIEKLGGSEVRHLNGIAWDNTVGNLEWGSSLENSADAVVQGTMSQRKSKQAKLTEEAVAYILENPDKWNNRVLARKFKVSREIVRDVRLGKRWQSREFPGKKAKFKPVVVVSVQSIEPEMTYGVSVEEDCSHVTGGIVTHNTGRLSARDPAFQTVPKHHKWAKALRRCYIAPPGMVVMERDYSQGELRVIACVANEKNMIQTYKEGKDLHTRTAASVAGHTYEELAAMKKTNKAYYEATRQKGKAGNFGMVFGMMPPGFVVYALKNYKVTMSLEEATKFRNGFFAEYPMLTEYHKAYKAFAHANGYVRSPLGRIRHLPLINSKNNEVASKSERQAINSPIQSTLSDMLIWSLALEMKAGLTKECPAFGVVHDSALNYVPEDNQDVWARKHLDIQQNLPFHLVGWNPQLPFPADAKLGINMADLEELAG
jgi:DNA polymerase I-like protein with 3'-5' exonuclease and polymerase domains